MSAKKNININVPLIIMGNYKPTGESITFVNFAYGPLRSVILIPSNNSTPESDYQTLCRGNYMENKFIEHDPNFIQPEKIICSYNRNIENALIIESRNDDRIDELIALQTEAPSVFISSIHHSVNDTATKYENISTPVKIQIEDMDDESILQLYIILNKRKRNEEDRKRII